MDEALALPSEPAATIALRTQQILAEESGVSNTVDPLGGSFFIENQTNRIEKQAYDYFQRIEELGGVLPAIEKGFFQSEISNAAYRYQREIDEGKRKIVGVNAYEEPARLPWVSVQFSGKKLPLRFAVPVSSSMAKFAPTRMLLRTSMVSSFVDSRASVVLPDRVDTMVL